MIKLEQQQNKNQQFKKIENAFNNFSNLQVNKNTNSSNPGTSQSQLNNKRISQFIYLFFTYAWYAVQINALVVRLIMQYILGLFFKHEKSVTNEIVLITGAGGYLG